MVCDYIFPKDKIFAGINLNKNEFKVYQGFYSELEKHVLKPNLIILLKADLDTLMHRIAIRARPFERGMDRMYIEKVSKAYDAFFSKYEKTNVLVLDTTSMDIVNNSKDRTALLARIEAISF